MIGLAGLLKAESFVVLARYVGSQPGGQPVFSDIGRALY